MKGENGTSSAPRHWEELDSLRGLAALAVFLGHFAAVFLPATVFGKGGHFAWETWFASTPLYLTVSGHAAVCLFFILSGFVLSVRYLVPGRKMQGRELLASVLKRPVRLGGIVLVTATIGLLCWWQGLFANQETAARLESSWLGYFWSRPPTSSDTLRLLTGPFFHGTHFNPPLWTIAVELYGSFMVFGLAWLLGRVGRWRWPLMVALVILLGRLPKWLASWGYQSDSIQAGHWGLIQGFIFGLMAAQLWHHRGWLQRLWQKRSIRWLWIIVALICMSYPHYASPQETWYAYLPRLTSKLAGGYPMLGAILLFLAVLCGWGRPLLLTRPLRYLGKYSYALYGCHFLILATVSCHLFLALDRLQWSYSTIVPVVFLATVMATAAATWLLHHAVDVPSIHIANWLGNWIRQRSTSAPANHGQ